MARNHSLIWNNKIISLNTKPLIMVGGLINTITVIIRFFNLGCSLRLLLIPVFLRGFITMIIHLIFLI